MSNFTLEEFKESNTAQKVHKLCRDGVCFYDEFRDKIKKDKNLRPELSDLWAILKDAANDKKLPKNRYRKENLGKKMPYNVYAAKSDHLRLYTFTDSEGLIIVIGGKKTDQDTDLKRIKDIVKSYKEFKTKKK
jgi:hypothetical protein